MHRVFFALALLFPPLGVSPSTASEPESLAQNSPIAPIERRIPPPGMAVPPEVRAELVTSLERYWETYEALDHPLKADCGIFFKAVEFALINGEFYREKDLETARRQLLLGGMRLRELAASNLRGNAPVDWGEGLLVRGYESPVDGSIQPYGLEIPPALDRSRPAPLIVWLHGRGDNVTDLYFIERCLEKSQVFQGNLASQAEFLVAHPFGRQCIGFKSAGETDVLAVIEEVKRHYAVDPARIYLAGFSMGGAGAWHLGAHYTDRFAALHAGAGFAETARYNNLAPQDYPPSYEQTLWGVYDVPGYARNLLNLPVVAYSGELDKQKAAADLMAEALLEHGLELPHLIGPGMGHKYDIAGVEGVLSVLREARWNPDPERLEFQTRTLRYSRMHWLQLTALERHWEDTRVSASRTPQWSISTQNVAGFRLDRPFPEATTLQVDGATITVTAAAPQGISLWKSEGTWTLEEPPGTLRKRPGLQGPIDDAFLDPFLVVLPSHPASNPRLQRWLEFEMDHFAKRWREVFRGHPRVKRDRDVTPEDLEAFHVIC